MARLKIAGLFVLLALVVFVVPTVLAGTAVHANVPSGGHTVKGVHPTGHPINLDKFTHSGPLEMIDNFGFDWDLYGDVVSGSLVNLSGVVDVGSGYDWNVTGTITGSPGNRVTNLTATNPQGDGCLSGYTDYFTYDGTGTLRQAGDWTSYCSGQVAGSGTWSGTFFAGGTR